MRYSTRFIHRIRENFLIVGLYDYEEIQQLKTLQNEYVEISLDALCCLKHFPNIKHLILTPGSINPDELDLLYGLRIKSLKLDFYTYEIDHYTIDIGSFPELELVFARTQYCFSNIRKCLSLKTLIVQEWLTPDLTYLGGSSVQALSIFSGKLNSLNGIAGIPNLISLSLSNQKQLSDCSQLETNRLESLGIENCGKINVMNLPVLPYVRMVYLSGRNKIPNIHTILQLTPILEWLLLDQRVEDGDLAPLNSLKHAVLFSDCRHYSHKNSELPKSTVRFQSNILSEAFEILPEAY